MNYLRVREESMRHVVDNKNFHCNLIIKRKIDQKTKNGFQNSPININLNNPVNVNLNSPLSIDLNNKKK